MLGYYYDDGEKVTEEVIARFEFVTGKAKMQYASRGVVLLSNGKVHTFGVRHKRDEHGNIHVVNAEPMRHQTYEEARGGIKEFEKQWITESLPEYIRNLEVLPLAGSGDPGMPPPKTFGVGRVIVCTPVPQTPGTVPHQAVIVCQRDGDELEEKPDFSVHYICADEGRDWYGTSGAYDIPNIGDALAERHRLLDIYHPRRCFP